MIFEGLASRINKILNPKEPISQKIVSANHQRIADTYLNDIPVDTTRRKPDAFKRFKDFKK